MFTNMASFVSPHFDKSLPKCINLYSYPSPSLLLIHLLVLIPQPPLKKRKNMSCFSLQVYYQFSESSDHIYFIPVVSPIN